MAVEDVTWCRAINHGVEPHFSQGSRFVRTTLRDTADALASHGDFVQSARGYLVNMAHVLKIDGLDFVLVNGEKVPISRDNSGAMRSAWADFAFERARRRV